MGVRGVQVRRGKNPRQGESLVKTKTKQAVQLRTSKIHKTRRQAGGLWIILVYIYLHLPKCAFLVLFGKFPEISQCGRFYCCRAIFAFSFPYVFCNLGAALKPILAYREVRRITWPHWPTDAHRFCLQAIVVRHQILRRSWRFCQSHIT